MKIIRKSVICSILMLAICILGFTVLFSKNNTVQIPKPDQMLIYKNGISYEIDPFSKEFNAIYKGCNKIRKQAVMESAIDEECIEDIKSRISLEYVYFETQTLEMGGYERNFSKLLFDFEGQDNVILYDSQYKSGTYKLDRNKFVTNIRLENIVRKF